MFRQSKELYGTWEMLCGNEVQVRPGRLVGRLQQLPQGLEDGVGPEVGLRGAAGLHLCSPRLAVQMKTLVILFSCFLSTCLGPGVPTPL